MVGVCVCGSPWPRRDVDTEHEGRLGLDARRAEPADVEDRPVGEHHAVHEDRGVGWSTPSCCCIAADESRTSCLTTRFPASVHRRTSVRRTA